MGLRDWIGLTPTLPAFAARLAADAAKRGAGPWTVEDGGETLRGLTGVVSLRNMFGEYSQAPRRERPGLYEKYLLLLTIPVEVPTLWTVAQTRLFPLVRSRADMMLAATQARLEGDTPWTVAERPLHGEVVVRLGYDTGPSIIPVRPDVLDGWGVSFEAALERAMTNLRSLPPPAWVTIAPGVWELQSEDAYQETFLLLPRAFDSLPATGGRYAIAPNRGVLLATTADAPGSLEALLDAARSALRERPWPMSPVVFEITPSGPVAIRPDGAAGRKLGCCERLDRATVYSDQQEILQKALGDDVYVASYGLVSGKSDPDEWVSWTSWTEGVPSLLPITDTLALVRSPDRDPETLQVRWEHAVQVVGALMQPIDEDPARFRVEQFPDAAQWAALKELAV
jgi:hypothetical protein